MNLEAAKPWIVVKVGGSLFDIEDLGQRLGKFLDVLPEKKVLLFPGGGPFTDAVRAMDEKHRLGEEPSHWLAVHSLGVSARFLACLLGSRAAIVSSAEQCALSWADKRIPILDPLEFAKDDARRSDALPCTWDVTSDSLALQVALLWQAAELFMLKSVPVSENWLASPPGQLVDAHFVRHYDRALQSGRSIPLVRFVDFRTQGAADIR